MRRKEKEIADKNEIESIIRKSLVCRLGLADQEEPYIVPLCFGYDNSTIYFHSAQNGKKIEILKRNNRVCFEFDIEPEVQAGKTACAWGMRYRSVIGSGKASFIDDPEEKRRALSVIMGQYTEMNFDFSEKAFQETLVIKVDITAITGKKSM